MFYYLEKQVLFYTTQILSGNNSDVLILLKWKENLLDAVRVGGPYWGFMQ